ncbi:neutrophil cytosol factor 4-like [Oscarella lobularis]|uniref:neutrophil cytosol factor 4-like n=1 Tax=Oscarella lobularis TaxID=121494 RepID=UPI003313CBCF
MPPQTIRSKEQSDEDDDVIDVDIVDIEKRREMQKYYVYVIEVTLRSKKRYIIYRRYNQFHNLGSNLEERFPIEAGYISAKERVLPSLPKKKFMGRSAIRDVAQERLPQLTAYLRTVLLSLPRKISRDPCVEQFIREKDYDSKPYKGRYSFRRKLTGSTDPSTDTRKRPPPPTKALPNVPKSRSSGSSSQQAPKRPTSGPPPLPSNKPVSSLSPTKTSLSVPIPSFLAPASKPGVKPKPSVPSKPPAVGSKPKPKPNPPPLALKPITGPRAKALYNYEARQSDELSFSKGDMMKLRQRLDDGWVEGQLNGKIGIAPVTYIEIIEDLQLEHSTDEWDTDDWDDDDDEGEVTLACFYKGRERDVTVSAAMASEPVYEELFHIISSALKQTDIVLNYKDRSDELVRLVDNTDMALLVKEGVPKQLKSADHVPWQIYVTRSGDLSVYSVKPKKQKKKQ